MAPPTTATSDYLRTLLDEADGTHVTVAWLIDHLGERSFGLTLLAMALLALVPGGSTIIGVLIVWPAIQMILGHHAPALPGRIARREVPVDKLDRVINRIVPALRWLERIFRPRWDIGIRTTKQITGLFMLMVGVTLISPFPFSHIIPALVIMLMALAYLEEDGIALLVSLVAAAISIAITIVSLWGAVETIDWIDPA